MNQVPPPNQVSSDPPDQRYGCALLATFFVIFLSASFVWNTQPSAQASLDSFPTSLNKYQAVFNDSIVSKLSSENKFGLAFQNHEWSNLYFELNEQSSDFDWIYTYTGDGTTTAHLPAVPVLNWLDPGSEGGGAGKLVPVLNSLLLIIALAMLTASVWVWLGWVAGTILGIIILIDPALFQSAFYSSHDGMIVALVVSSATLVGLGTNRIDYDTRIIWKFVVAGLLFGATTLYQFQQSLWVVLLLAFWLCFLVAKLIRKQKLGSFCEGSLLFIIGLLLVAAPWWMRNIKTCRSLKPLGNVIHSNLIGAYSDAAVETGGDLNFTTITKTREAEFTPLEFTELSYLEKEEHFADYSWKAATDWIEENPSDVQTLMMNRVRNHFGFGDIVFDGLWNKELLRWLPICGIIGCFLCWTQLGRLVLPVVVASVLVTALTWSDEGRLSLPLRPLLYATFAGAIANLVRLVSKKKRPDQEA